MKIFAEFIEDNGSTFRTKTLLQFGDSWDLIGSIVMKNPGSAKPGKLIDSNISKLISNFYSSSIDPSKWYISEGDPTIKKIAPIFNGNYVGENIELNGIIQIFNLMNICDGKTDKAFAKAEKCSSKYLLPDTNEVIYEFKGKPVYLGFWDFYTNKKSIHYHELNDTANRIFDYIKKSQYMYFNHDDIIDNPFYHPFSKQIDKEKNQPLLRKFFSFYN